MPQPQFTRLTFQNLHITNCHCTKACTPNNRITTEFTQIARGIQIFKMFTIVNHRIAMCWHIFVHIFCPLILLFSARVSQQSQFTKNKIMCCQKITFLGHQRTIASFIWLTYQTKYQIHFTICVFLPLLL